MGLKEKSRSIHHRSSGRIISISLILERVPNSFRLSFVSFEFLCNDG